MIVNHVVKIGTRVIQLSAYLNEFLDSFYKEQLKNNSAVVIQPNILNDPEVKSSLIEISVLTFNFSDDDLSSLAQQVVNLYFSVYANGIKNARDRCVINTKIFAQCIKTIFRYQDILNNKNTA